MKIKHAFLVVAAFACLLGAAFADEPKQAKPQPAVPEQVALTDAEQKQLAPVVQAFIAQRAAYQKAVADAQAVDVADCAKVTAAVAKLQLTFERFTNSDAALANLQEQLARAHGCEGCKLHQDLKSLVKPPSALKP